MKPLVIEYLKTHTFQDLEDEHGVCARPSLDGTKFSLNYDQILVKNGDPIAEQCRGLVIRPHEYDFMDFMDTFTNRGWKGTRVGECDVLAWPMNRFYNQGDTHAVEIDWSDPLLRVYEKLDGTMIVVYWDPLKNEWCAATRSVPDADLPIRKDHMEIGDMTFSQLFFKTFGEQNHDTNDLKKELTYVFELTTPYNRIVVKYDSAFVTLLAARHTATGREISIEDFNVFKHPKTWYLKSAAAIDAFVNNADPADLEGAVVCDSQFRRVKIKNKSWVLSSKAKDLVTVSRRSALLAIIKNEIDDVLPLVEKDIADELLRMKDGVLTYVKDVDANFAEFKSDAGTDRKTFASFVTTSGEWMMPYFSLWDRRANNTLELLQKMAADDKLSDSSLDLLLKMIG